MQNPNSKTDETPTERIKRIEREIAERERQREGGDALLEAHVRVMLADRKRALEDAQKEGGA